MPSSGKKPKSNYWESGESYIIGASGAYLAASAHFENWRPGGKLQIGTPLDTRRHLGDTWETPMPRCHYDTHDGTTKFFVMFQGHRPYLLVGFHEFESKRNGFCKAEEPHSDVLTHPYNFFQVLRV